MLTTKEWVDSKGRRWLRGLPEGVPASQAEHGVPLGPPPLDSLGLPEETEVRLHNELFARGIFSERDARTKMQEVASAVQAAYRADVHSILAVYQGQGAVDGKA